MNDQGTVLGKADFIARWNSTDGHWYALGGGTSDGALNNTVRALATDGANIYVGGDFSTVKDGTDSTISNAAFLARWNGTEWSAVPGSPINNFIYALVFSNNTLYVGGQSSILKKWSSDTQTWSNLGNNSLSGNILSIAVDGSNVGSGSKYMIMGN